MGVPPPGTKYLGLILDKNLTWESHIKELNKKLINYIGILSKVRHCLPMACRKTMYNAFIFSRLNYGCESFVNTTRKYIQPLTVTQNKLLRILRFKPIRKPLKHLYREFNALKLKEQNYFNICCIAHKFIHSPNSYQRLSTIYSVEMNKYMTMTRDLKRTYILQK